MSVTTVRPLLSVVVPTLDEAPGVGDLLSDLSRLAVPLELIVADGGSRDRTRSICEAAGATVIRAPRGRGTQLQEGARRAQAPLLFFVHADARLDREARAVLEEVAIVRPRSAMAFRLRIDAPGLDLRMIERGANWRSRLCGLPYGDQGLIVRREDYVRAGGYPPVPIMEDVSLVRRLRRITRIEILPGVIRVSPRRWRSEGAWRRTLLNWIVLFRYFAGAPPERLAALYGVKSAGRG